MMTTYGRPLAQLPSINFKILFSFKFMWTEEVNWVWVRCLTIMRLKPVLTITGEPRRSMEVYDSKKSSPEEKFSHRPSALNASKGRETVCVIVSHYFNIPQVKSPLASFSYERTTNKLFVFFHAMSISRRAAEKIGCGENLLCAFVDSWMDWVFSSLSLTREMKGFFTGRKCVDKGPGRAANAFVPISERREAISLSSWQFFNFNFSSSQRTWNEPLMNLKKRIEMNGNCDCLLWASWMRRSL